MADWRMSLMCGPGCTTASRSITGGSAGTSPLLSTKAALAAVKGGHFFLLLYLPSGSGHPPFGFVFFKASLMAWDQFPLVLTRPGSGLAGFFSFAFMLCPEKYPSVEKNGTKSGFLTAHRPILTV